MPYHVAPIAGDDGAPFAPTLAVVGVAALAYATAWYRQAARDRPIPSAVQGAAFLSGLALLAWALLGAPEQQNDASLFSHMLQHVVLAQASAPLLAAGRPLQVWLQGLPGSLTGPLLRPALRASPLVALGHGMGHPLVAWALFNGGLVFWHLPRWHNLALADPSWHAAQHATFFGTALVFWWVVLDPTPRPFRPSAHVRMLMCFASGMVGDLIALPLTLAPRVLYAGYDEPARALGLDPLVLQYRAGLLMWVSGALFYAVMLAIPILDKRRSIEGQDQVHAGTIHPPA